MIFKKYIFLLIFLVSFRSCYPQVIEGTLLQEADLFELAGRSASEIGKIQVEQSIEYFKSKKNYSLLYELDISYGFNEKLGIELTIPIFIKRKSGPFSSWGLSNIIIQLEWTPFQREADQLLIMFGPVLPSGSKDKIPPIESGSIGAIFQLNAIHADEHWYAQTDWGAIINSQRGKNTKLGNLYFYTLSGGRRFKINSCSLSTYYLILEMSGFYFERDKLEGRIIEESGATLIMLGPLIAWSRENLLAQVLLQWPIGQHLFGQPRPKFDFRSAVSFQFTF